MRKKIIHCLLEVKKSDDKDGRLLISGWANKNIIDDYNEVVDPLGGDITRYKKNPVLLFNHDMNYPIGLVNSIELREEGVYVEGEVIKSDNPKISYVYDLVKSGVLKTFSIGFSADEVEPSEDKSHLVIKKWKLFEISIVSIPANEDSSFEAQIKSLASLGANERRKQILITQGCGIAYLLADKCDDSVISTVSKNLGMDCKEVRDMFVGRKFFTKEVLDAVVKEASIEDHEFMTTLLSVQECVSEMVPKLIADGVPVSDALQQAVEKCTDKEKSVESDPQTQVADNSESATIVVDLAKAQTALIGDMSVKLSGVLSAVEKTNELLENISRLLRSPDESEPKEEPTEGEEKLAEDVKLCRDRIEATLKRLGF